jgi:predicted AAA+ superfamily ATPase
MEDRIRKVVETKLGDALVWTFPQLVRRDASVSANIQKARAIIGMRRAGKTSLLFQILKDRLDLGVPRERLIYFNFEDERLAGMEATDLDLLLGAYYRRFPAFRQNETVVWCLDEIQLIPEWERFVRRMLDSEKVEIFLSGSSASMLSREVATSMRGRATETVVAPFSFREFLRATDCEPNRDVQLLGAAECSTIEAGFEAYLRWGGFPEIQSTKTDRERVELLQSYVDVVLLRDVAERHKVGNLTALRAFVRQLLRSPAQLLSVNKVYRDFRSRGISVSKETLLDYLTYLEDAFLVFTLPLAVGSERRRQTNPRKLYLTDHGLARAHASGSALDRGRMLENIVAGRLLAESMDLGYLLTEAGYEVDFLARDFEGNERLIQVASDVSDPATFEREVRALNAARAEFGQAQAILLSETPPPKGVATPEWLKIVSLWRWLLGG